MVTIKMVLASPDLDREIDMAWDILFKSRMSSGEKDQNILGTSDTGGQKFLDAYIYKKNRKKDVASDYEDTTEQEFIYYQALDFFKKANQDIKIKTIIKPALDSLKEIKNENIIFDIIFIDADKSNYQKYYDEVIDLTKKDGLIIIDNVLWHGEVADTNNKENLTNIIRDFNNYVKNDKKTEQIIIPLGDGLTICRKL